MPIAVQLCFFFILYFFIFFLLFLFFLPFGQGMAKTIKVGRVVAVLAMAFLNSSFYLVICARVLYSNLEGYMNA